MERARASQPALIVVLLAGAWVGVVVTACRLSIAFIRYRLRTNCEFAKEAMANQKLDGDENLNLKWAYDDPNPVAKDAIRRADADAALALLQVGPPPPAASQPARLVVMSPSPWLPPRSSAAAG